MVSNLAWLDSSHDDQKRMRELLRLFSDQESRDDFSPYWVYPGDAKIERFVLPYPLSRDVTRLERLKRDLAMYRMAFGQPRQEDMLELLRQRGVDGESIRRTALNLRPPSG